MAQDFVPKPYQDLIAQHILEQPRSAIWAGMGMGKTSATLLTLDRLYLMGRTRPTLVVAPLLVANSTWPDEVGKWRQFSALSIVPIVGSEKQRREALAVDAPIYTINYENLPWLVEYYGNRWPFIHVVADESTRLKGFRTRQGTKQAKALGTVAHRHVKYFTELTGTPAPNGYKDLWGQMWMLDAGERLGRSYTAFTDRWFHTNRERHITRLQPWAEPEIKSLLSDICLTLDPKDWFDLKEPIVSNRYAKMPGRAMDVYRKMEEEFFVELDQGGSVEAVHAAARSQKLLQIANGAVYLTPEIDDDDDPRAREFREVHDAKLQVLDSVITEAAGMPVLVAYNFRSDLARLKKAFPKGVCLTDGDAMANMKAWNKGKIPILFVHPKSAGHGLNLQLGGNILVYFAQDWDLEKRLQVLERIGPVRQAQAGLDRPVFVYNILMKDTIDELVLARVETKKGVQDILLDAMNRRKNAKRR